MKILITESQKEKAALFWMNKNFSPDQLEVITHPDYPNSIFYKKDGKVVMEQDKENEYFWFNYDEIWSFFKSFFGMEYKEIKDVLNTWLEETFKLEGFTPKYIFNIQTVTLEETFKLEGFTPEWYHKSFHGCWKRLSN